MERPVIYAIDFDGTIVEDAFPGIGKLRPEAEAFIRRLRKRGDIFILYTMREGQLLAAALNFLLTNENVIHSAEELPHGWGCYEVGSDRIKWKFGVRYTNCADIPLNGNKKEELRVMRSFIRRSLKK